LRPPLFTAVYTLLRRPAATPFQNFSITQLTNTGKVQKRRHFSGRQVSAQRTSDTANESLWLRNIPTGSDTQVLPASGQSFAALVFSPDDGNSSISERPRGA